MPATWIPLNFFGPPYLNLSDTSVPGLSTKVTNTYIDEANHSQKRPGLLEWTDLATAKPIDGVFWWESESVLVVLSDSRVWIISSSSGAAIEVGGSATFNTNTPATFTFDANRAYLANGTKIVHFTRIGNLTEMVDADAPTKVSHVAFLDQYILANVVGGGTWQFSEVLVGTDWRAVDIFTAESSPDNLLALHTSQGEIVLLGSQSTEFWANDGVSPFSVIRGTTIAEGGASPYTFDVLNRRKHWLTDKRRFIEIAEDKRQPTEVSLPINKELDALSDVSDARGFKCSIDGLPLYVLTFPNANKTFVYNYLGKHWSEWDTWDAVRGEPTRWLGNNYAYAKAWNLHIVGDRNVGKLYLAATKYTDDNGAPIRLTRRSGFIDHDTSEEKRSFQIRFSFRRAQGNDKVTNPKFLLRWRNNTGAWGPFREGSLGAEGDHAFFVSFYRLGRYRSRQWELIYMENAGFELNTIDELVDRLGSSGSNVTRAQQPATQAQT